MYGKDTGEGELIGRYSHSVLLSSGGIDCQWKQALNQASERHLTVISYSDEHGHADPFRQ